MRKKILVLCLCSSLLFGCSTQKMKSIEETTTESTEETSEYSSDLTYINFKDLTIATTFEILEKGKNSIAFKGDEFSPYNINITVAKRKGNSVEGQYFEDFDKIIDNLGYSNYTSKEYMLDDVRDVALVYKFEDYESVFSIAFVQHNNKLYTFKSEYDSELDIYKDDSEESPNAMYELEDFLDFITYSDVDS